MKSILSLFFLLSLSWTGYAQLSDSKTDLYQSKVESYTKMKKAGSSLSIIGGGLTFLGVALVSSADWETTTDEYGYTQSTTDGSGVVGILSLSVGIPLAITGIILNSTGNRKAREYAKKLEDVDVSYYKQGGQKGLTLAIRF